MAAKKLYAQGPKIKPDDKGDTNKSANQQGSKVGAERTAASPPKPSDVSGKTGSTTKGDVMAGTDGIPTHHTQSGERTALHSSHMLEHSEMMGRHERDHLARALGHGDMTHEQMNAVHLKERQTLHTRHEGDWRAAGGRHAMTQTAKGTSGTQQS